MDYHEGIRFGTQFLDKTSRVGTQFLDKVRDT